MKSKVVAFIPVRLTSSRLPVKHLCKIGDRTLLSWVVKRLVDAKCFDEIVVCAPDEPESSRLVEFCKDEDVEMFSYPGDVNDVVGRLTAAAKQFNADVCVLASGDCPLANSGTIKKLVSTLLGSEADIAAISELEGKNVIHEGILVMRRAVWELAEQLSDTSFLREHQFPVIYQKPDEFSHFKNTIFSDDEEFYLLNHRVSIDTPSDLEFHSELYESVSRDGAEYNLSNVIAYLLEDSTLLNLNDSVRQKGLFDESRKVVFFVTAVSRYGYGNLMRSIEVARNCIDLFGMSIEFVVSDDVALKCLEEEKLRGVVFQGWDWFLSRIAGVNAVVFDVNRDFMVPEKYIETLKQSGKIFVVDNVQPWTRYSDRIVVPTAHYTGQKLPNLASGPEYVVIRRQVRRYLTSEKENRNLLVTYANNDVCDQLVNNEATLLTVRYPDLVVRNYREFTADFLESLACARFFVSPMGVSVYEAIFLGVVPVVVGVTEQDVWDIQMLEDYLYQEKVKIDGDGAVRIAGELYSTISYKEKMSSNG